MERGGALVAAVGLEAAAAAGAAGISRRTGREDESEGEAKGKVLCSAATSVVSVAAPASSQHRQREVRRRSRAAADCSQQACVAGVAERAFAGWKTALLCCHTAGSLAGAIACIDRPGASSEAARGCGRTQRWQQQQPVRQKATCRSGVDEAVVGALRHSRMLTDARALSCCLRYPEAHGVMGAACHEYHPGHLQ